MDIELNARHALFIKQRCRFDDDPNALQLGNLSEETEHQPAILCFGWSACRAGQGLRHTVLDHRNRVGWETPLDIALSQKLARRYEVVDQTEESLQVQFTEEEVYFRPFGEAAGAVARAGLVAGEEAGPFHHLPEMIADCQVFVE